jgi:hypothetical protein
MADVLAEEEGHRVVRSQLHHDATGFSAVAVPATGFVSGAATALEVRASLCACFRNALRSGSRSTTRASSSNAFCSG